MGSQDQISGRIVALLDVNDDLSITASIDANRNHEADIGTTLIGTNEADPGTFAAFYNGVLAGSATHCAIPTGRSALLQQQGYNGRPLHDSQWQPEQIHLASFSAGRWM